MFPVAPVLWEKRRSRPFRPQARGGVRFVALMALSNPSVLAAVVAAGFPPFPPVAFPRRMLGFDHGHDGIPVESDAPVVDVKVWCNDGVELRDIVRARCSEYHAHCVYDLSLVGG